MAIWQQQGDPGASIADDLVQAARGSALLARLLVQRGVNTPALIRDFLDLDGYTPTPPDALPDMAPAVERLLKAIDDQDPILVFGDFDVDGITGTSVLMETLTLLGAKVSSYIPDRASEGHGLNTAALCRLVSSRQLKVVITTDTGITNFNEVSLLNGLKVDTIITDHHQLPEHLPPALANINPQRLIADDPEHPLAFLAGVGVAYKLSEALMAARNVDPSALEALLDLVAIGTVADLASLHRENRYLVWRGIQVLNRRQRLGIKEILLQAGVDGLDGLPPKTLTSETIGFTIGPRLNALGRLDKAGPAVELLTTRDGDRARIIAAQLEALNRKRQALCEQTFLEAQQHLNSHGVQIGPDPGDRRAVILASPDWNPGIIGIVASRLIEQYHVPTFLMMADESAGEARCSARSIPGVDLHDSLSQLEHYFTRFGGHAGAAGFSVPLTRLEAFKQDLYALMEQRVSPEMMQPLVTVDATLDWSQLTTGLVDLIQPMAPFGMDNRAPKFQVNGAHVASRRALGQDAKHLKLVLTPAQNKANQAPVEALIWGGASEPITADSAIDIVGTPELNTFNGVTRLQLILDDWRPAGGGTSKPSLSLMNRAHTPARPTVATQPTAPLPAQAEDGATAWVDHRGRPDLPTFVADHLLTDSAVWVFHEGGPPRGLVFPPGRVLTRESAPSAEPVGALLFWDLPPDAASLSALLSKHRPNQVHWVGGKYQSVPVVPRERDTLAVLLKLLRGLEGTGGPFRVNPQALAVKLATTPAVLMNALLVLQRLALVATAPDERPDGEDLVLTLLAPPEGLTLDPGRQLEWQALRHALQEVGRYRQWLLSAPLGELRVGLRPPSAEVLAAHSPGRAYGR